MVRCNAFLDNRPSDKSDSIRLSGTALTFFRDAGPVDHSLTRACWTTPAEMRTEPPFDVTFARNRHADRLDSRTNESERE